MRREFTSKIKLAAFERSGGRCETCNARLFPGNVHYDHRIADGLGGEPTLDNCDVLCRACHSTKTRLADVPNIARAKRRQQAFIGAARISRTPMPFGRRSKFKKKITGEVVER